MRPTSSSWTATRSPTSRLSAGCAGSSPAAATTCRTAAVSTSALQAPRSRRPTFAWTRGWSAWRRRGARCRRSPPAVDDEVETPPVDVDALKAGRAQVLKLRSERHHVPDVVLPPDLLLRRLMRPLVRQLRVAALGRPFPGGRDHGVVCADRVVVEVPAAGHQAP